MLKLSALFSDHAVLQNGISIPVWGWTEPKSMVECTLADRTAMVKSQPDGKFMLRLKAMPCGGPHELKVRNMDSGEEVTVRDVMVGEVWLASGQSNMEMNLNATWDKDSIDRADLPKVRMITVPHMARVGGQEDFEGSWLVSTPQDSGLFSAAGFYFARKLNAELNVAVGIIHSSWGGTCAETWNSRESLMANPAMVSLVQSYEERVFQEEIWKDCQDCDVVNAEAMVEKAVAKFFDNKEIENKGVAQGWAAPDFNDSSWRGMELPGGWKSRGENYNGVLWFRKEVEVPAGLVDGEWVLSIGAVDKQDITYVNGIEVGATGHGFETVYWNTIREYKVPRGVLKPGRNVIAVRAYSFIYEGGMIGPAQAMRLEPAGKPGAAIPLAGVWRFNTEVNLGNVAIPTISLIIGPGAPNSPYMLFDNMIRPLVPYAMRGAIWYQGESNADRWPAYCGLMKGLIGEWRRVWGQGAFPFYQVQLANYYEPQAYQDGSKWARIREAQSQAAEPAGSVAVAIDCGEADDIHPKDKKTVGERLAALALHHTYHKREVVPCGPVYSHMVIEGESIRLYFDHCEKGLQGTDGFFIAGADLVFKPAQAVIEGDTVLVSNSEVPIPTAVRYAWADNPKHATLRNGAGLPASPFRTDC